MLALILAGCGGSGEPKVSYHVLTTPAFSFQAPVGWPVKTQGDTTTAASGSELVQVASFPLARVYTPALFTRVESELATRMGQVARASGGTVTGHSVVTAGGIRSHAYTVQVGDHVDSYVFVLRNKREFQLLCRRKSSNRARFCEQLVSSFRLG